MKQRHVEGVAVGTFAVFLVFPIVIIDRQIPCSSILLLFFSSLGEIATLEGTTVLFTYRFRNAARLFQILW